jgi:hypothetical protein
MNALRRVRQFWGALTARVDPREVRSLNTYLTSEQTDLFLRMSQWEQRHGLNVFGLLCSSGCEDKALLQAALLHDVGKSTARITVWHRTTAVLLGRFWPQFLARLASPTSTGWLYPLYVLRQHGSLGASLAAGVGCSPEVQAYIRQHDHPIFEGPVAWLRWADGQLPSRKEVTLCPESPLSERD